MSKPELQQYVAGIQQTYTVPKHGVATVTNEEVAGKPAIKTFFQMDDRYVVAWHLLEDNEFIMRCRMIETTSIQIYQYIEDTMEIYLILNQKNQVIEIKNIGLWNSLGRACQLLLDNAVLKGNQLNLFLKKGLISAVENTNDDSIVCHCLQISTAVLKNYIATGATDIEKLEAVCGAGRVCGSCRPSIEELLQQTAR